jgi:hypothetical protein
MIPFVDVLNIIMDISAENIFQMTLIHSEAELNT